MTLQGVAFEYMYEILSKENRGGSKLVSIRPFYKLPGRQVSFPGPNGRNHERSIKVYVFCVFSTFCRHPNRSGY
jgi:hypothetical protein